MKQRWLRVGFGAFLFSYAAMAAGTTEGLRAKHAELRAALASNAFGRPLHLDSTESPDRLQGELHAVLDHPFSRLADALGKPSAWCGILVLPLHVRSCDAGTGNLALDVASKLGADAGNSARLQLAFKVTSRTKDFLAIQLSAPDGPLGTRNYRVAIEAIPLDAGRSFIHLSYSYGYGSMAKLATQTYLNTSGKGKTGFTQVEQPDGKRGPVGGMRGVLERNAMRYFLAVDAYLRSLSAPRDQQVDQRLKAWHASLERHPKQLREPQADYLALKREQMLALGKAAPR